MHTTESIADSMIKHATNTFWFLGTSGDIFASDILYDPSDNGKNMCNESKTKRQRMQPDRSCFLTCQRSRLDTLALTRPYLSRANSPRPPQPQTHPIIRPRGQPGVPRLWIVLSLIGLMAYRRGDILSSIHWAGVMAFRFGPFIVATAAGAPISVRTRGTCSDMFLVQPLVSTFAYLSVECMIA
jgi:hypothetical protein